LLVSNRRPPVVYLRAFKDDAVGASVPNAPLSTTFALVATEEQQIAEVFGELGPFVAIGRPDEWLPELGAARIYVSDKEWQQKVSDLMTNARLVVFRASDTPGLTWEVGRGGELLPPEKLVFLIPADTNYAKFRQITEALLPGRLPEMPRSKLRCGSLVGLVYFDSAWRSYFVAPRHTWFRNKIRKPLSSTLRVMVQPVFLQLGSDWSPPALNWGIYVPYLGITVILPLGLMVFVALVGDWTSVLVIFILVGMFHSFMLLTVGLAYLFSARSQQKADPTVRSD